MSKPKRFFECLLPVSVCNIKCPYCYVVQENRREMKYADLRYSPEHIAKALRKDRVGGVCWISICGLGETLAQKEIADIVYYLLKEGHYVNITTNGTLTKRFKQIIEKCHVYTNRLHFSFSFHYTELKRLGLIDRFFDNIRYVKENGASFLLQINLCDEYLPFLDEIKEISLQRTGALPQVALTRNEESIPMKIWSNLSDEEYYEIGSSFNSPLFDFTYKNFNVMRKEFCYAGDWSFVLNLQTGWLQKCYANPQGQNIFNNIDSKIKFEAIGNHCRNHYCVNSSHFMSLGVIPDLDTPSYSSLRDREGALWYSENMKAFLNSKLIESNKQYSKIKKYYVNIKNSFENKVKNKKKKSVIVNKMKKKYERLAKRIKI